VRSDLYDRFKYQAETIAKDTLFSNAASLEIIQGLSGFDAIGEANDSIDSIVGRCWGSTSR